MLALSRSQSNKCNAGRERERKGHPSTSRLVKTAKPHEYFKDSSYHPPTASTHQRGRAKQDSFTNEWQETTSNMEILKLA